MTKKKYYKGFDKDLKCKGFQYEVGKDYIHEGEVKICESGFHCCENPLDVLYYYDPAGSRFCEVTPSGKIAYDSDDSKIACSKLHVGCEIGISGLVSAGVKFILNKAKKKNTSLNTGNYSVATNTGNCSVATNTGYRSAATNTGNCSVATNTGYRSAATNTGNYSVATNTGYRSAATNTGNYSVATNMGYYSVATNTGYRSAATNTGDYSVAANTGNYSVATNTGNCSVATNTGYRSAATNTGNYSVATNMGYYSVATNTGYRSVAEVGKPGSIAIVSGKNSKAKGVVDSWLVLTERDNNFAIKSVKAVKVDGIAIKADTWYTLIDGIVTESN